MPAAALLWRFPLLRNDSLRCGIDRTDRATGGRTREGDWRNPRVPNEDSLDLDFSDANLFSFNRYDGIDRQDGGSRVDAALHAAWYGGANGIDFLLGQSFRTINDTLAVAAWQRAFRLPLGLCRASQFQLGRPCQSQLPRRFDPKSMTPQHAGRRLHLGRGLFALNGGYFFSNTDPYNLYDSATLRANYYDHRNEIYLGATSQWNQWSVSAMRGAICIPT